jgi:hypothetical protein
MIEEALAEARRLAHENRLEGKDLDELAELEDDEDDDFLESYRQKRLAEMSAISSASIYNQVYHLQKPDYSRDVTDASKTSFVLVLLTSASGGNSESKLMVELWRELALKFGDIKFCQIRADMCIEGYPERNTPTVLVYKDGDIQRQIITLKELSGIKTTTRGKRLHISYSISVLFPNLRNTGVTATWRMPIHQIWTSYSITADINYPLPRHRDKVSSSTFQNKNYKKLWLSSVIQSAPHLLKGLYTGFSRLHLRYMNPVRFEMY